MDALLLLQLALFFPLSLSLRRLGFSVLILLSLLANAFILLLLLPYLLILDLSEWDLTREEAETLLLRRVPLELELVLLFDVLSTVVLLISFLPLLLSVDEQRRSLL